jgi:prephenate dehydrogenase
MSFPRSIAIVGANGQFGRIFTRKLLRESCEVSGIDLAAAPAEPGLARYLSGDASNPSDGALEFLRAADAVLLCIPEEPTVQLLPRLLERLEEGSLVLDISSIKSRIAQTVAAQPFRGGYLSLHPMFGPIEDFTGLHLAVIPLRPSAAGDAVAERLRRWGAVVTEITAEQHDRATAWLQIGAHAALLAWAASAQHTGLPPTTLLRLTTTLNIPLLALVARMSKAGADVYYDIQSANPYGSDFREQLRAAIADLTRIAESGDRAAFAAWFEEIDALLGDSAAELSAFAAEIVEATREREAR